MKQLVVFDLYCPLLHSHRCLAMYAQTNVGLLCCVASGSNVPAALDSSATGIGECKAVETINTYMCMYVFVCVFVH